MTRSARAGLVVALILASTSLGPSAQDAAAVVAAASKAMGVDALKTAQFSATGHDFALGQAPTPPTPPSPYTVSLFDNIRRLKLDVTRIIPVHYPADNRTITLAELTRWAGKSSS